MFGATINPPRYKESWIVTAVDKYVATLEGSANLKYKWNKRKHFKRLPSFSLD